MVVSDRSDGGVTGGQVQLPNTATSLIHGCQQSLQPTAISDGKWLHQDFHASPAGQAETFVFLGADAVLDDSGARSIEFFAMQSRQQIFFHASPGQGADLQPAGQGDQQRTYRSRR